MNDDLIRDQPFLHQFQRQRIRHLPQNQLRLRRLIGMLQNLTGTQAVRLRPVSLHRLYGTGFPPPGMVNQKLRIFSKKAVEQFLVLDRASRHVSHRIQAKRGQPFGIPPPDPPEIRDRTVGPEFSAVRHFIQLCDPNPVLICRDMLGPHIHRHLAKIQIRPDSRRCRDSGLVQYVQNHSHGKVVGRQVIRFQIRGRIDEDLIDRVNNHILRRHVLHVNSINACAVRHIGCHTRRCDQEVQGKRRIFLPL